jgi:HK97 family phage major capsid protein
MAETDNQEHSKAISDETLVYFGDAIKSLGDGRIEGYLVRFTDETNPDLTGDYFSPETDFGIESGATIPVYYQHGMDSHLKTRKIGRGQVTFDEVGAWLQAQIELRDEYEKGIEQLVAEGKMGWSSGAASHLVEREPVGKSWHIKTWVIAEASLTPTPAEPRNLAVPIKSLFPSEAVVTDKDEQNPTLERPDEVTTIMELEEIKTLIDGAIKTAADEAVKKYAESQPEVKAGFASVQVTEDETDRALKGFTPRDFIQAVKRAAYQPHDIDKRLLAHQERAIKDLKASGLNENIPSQGGFLVQQDVAAGILDKMWGVGTVLSRFAAIPVSGNGLVLNGVDETSRSDGYRMGGVQGYWLEEGGTKTATKPKFYQVDLKLKKVCAAAYATDELLEDASALESWLLSEVPNELRFKVEAAIINGDGVGKPLGILPSPALVSIARVDASEIDSVDVAKLWALRYPGANDYVWFCNANIMPQLLNMSIGNYPIYLPPGGYSAAPYGSLLGRPIIETEYNPGLGTLGDILLASPSQYALISKGGVKSASSIHVQFLTDETTFRWTYRVDGQPKWAAGVTAYASTDTISPFVALTASS